MGSPVCANVNQGAPGYAGMLQAMKESYKKGDSDSILALSPAGGIARCRLKRRQGYRWAGLLSFEKPMEQDADFVPVGRKATRQPR